MSEEKPSVAQKFLAFTKKLVEGAKRFFHSKEVKEKYPEEKVKQVIQELSPLGVRNKTYGADIMR